MLQTGWFDFARAELEAGRNPAEKGWRHTFCSQLLQGNATRETLRIAFITELELTPDSAKVQLSNALAIFAAGRLAVESRGELWLVSKGIDRP